MNCFWFLPPIPTNIPNTVSFCRFFETLLVATFGSDASLIRSWMHYCTTLRSLTARLYPLLFLLIFKPCHEKLKHTMIIIGIRRSNFLYRAKPYVSLHLEALCSLRHHTSRDYCGSVNKPEKRKQNGAKQNLCNYSQPVLFGQHIRLCICVT
jgi:hypothetical protein